MNWKGANFGGAPRYSRPVNWRGTPSLGKVRYSQPVNWRGANFGGAPRYSKPVSWRGAYFPGSPRYSTFKHRFDVSKKWKKMTNDYNPLTSKYDGDYKIKKPSHKNMHPSVNYYNAKPIASKTIRKGLRKWNIFWVRLNDQKLVPKGSRKVAKKPKFDRKERDIWIDSRDRKPTTRDDGTAGAETAEDSIDDSGD